MKRFLQSALFIMSMLMMVVSVSSCDDDDDDNKKGESKNLVAGRTFVRYDGVESKHLASAELDQPGEEMELFVVEFAKDGTYTEYFLGCYFGESEQKFVIEQGESKGSYEVKDHDLIISYKSYNENEEEVIESETLHIKQDGEQIIIWTPEVEAVSSSSDAYTLIKEFKTKHSHAN